MGLFGKSKAEKAEEERARVQQEEDEFQARIAEEAQGWIDAIEQHRNGAVYLTPELLQSVGELPQPGSAEDKSDYRSAADDIAMHKGNMAKIEATLSSNRTEQEKAALWTDYNFWLSVQNHLRDLAFYK